MNAKEARDASRDYADDLGGRWIKDGLGSAEVQTAARLEAEQEVLAQQKSEFDAQVAAILKTASTEATDN